MFMEIIMEVRFLSYILSCNYKSWCSRKLRVGFCIYIQHRSTCMESPCCAASVPQKEQKPLESNFHTACFYKWRHDSRKKHQLKTNKGRYKKNQCLLVVGFEKPGILQNGELYLLFITEQNKNIWIKA